MIQEDILIGDNLKYLAYLDYQACRSLMVNILYCISSYLVIIGRLAD